jgi:hypothetical protein
MNISIIRQNTAADTANRVEKQISGETRATGRYIYLKNKMVRKKCEVLKFLFVVALRSWTG